MKKTTALIIGAGPIGLALASRLMKKAIPFLLLEKGDSPGHNMLQWGHVPLFTNWAESVDTLSMDLLKKHGIGFQVPDSHPRGAEFAKKYLGRISGIIPDHQIQCNAKVTSIQYARTSKNFEVSYENSGDQKVVNSSFLFDASGTWQTPTPLIKHKRSSSYIPETNIPNTQDIGKIAEGSKVAVIGGGHSAMNSLLFLSEREDLKLCWLIRADQPRFGKSKVGGKSAQLEKQIQSLISEGRVDLTTNFDTQSIEGAGEPFTIQAQHGLKVEGIHKIISNIGFSPDHGLVKNFELRLDEKYDCPVHLSDKINPALHSCDSVSYHFQDTLATDLHYYLIGSKTFGKASNFLLSKGYSILDEMMESIDFRPEVLLHEKGTHLP
ncbi:MAG: NAD(P)-binding domain-containing protein [Bacteroidota bacterium]